MRTAVNLNDLLRAKNIDAAKVLVFRHRPNEPELNRVLPWLAAEKPDIFNAYQQTQTEKVEKAMKGAGYVAAFIRHAPGQALFVGLYEVGTTKPLNREQFWSVPAYAELKQFGLKGFSEDDCRNTVLWFELALT